MHVDVVVLVDVIGFFSLVGRFGAFDSRTGKELWVMKLEAGGHATRMTFQGRKTGKRFVVIAAGGGGYFSKTWSDVIAAYALP